LLRRIRGLPEDEAVEEAKRALLEVNSLRKPYYMWRLDMDNGIIKPTRLRLSLPSRNIGYSVITGSRV